MGLCVCVHLCVSAFIDAFILCGVWERVNMCACVWVCVRVKEWESAGVWLTASSCEMGSAHLGQIGVLLLGEIAV